jgi:serine/threonine protein kinase
MAPEQFQGHPRRASDQYALAIVVYEWLTGDRPFHGSFSEIASQHLFVAPTSLCEKVPTISLAVEQVVLRALAKDPAARFASVQAFATALEHASQPASSQPIALPSELPSLSQPVLPTDMVVAFPSPQLSGAPNVVASFAPPTEVLSATSLAEPFSTPNLPNSENIPSVPKTGRNSAIASHHQGFHIRRTILLIGLALLVIASGIGLFAVIHANQLATFNATAQSSTDAAASTAPHTKTATPTPTPPAGATNNDPYPPGTWHLALYDPLSQPSYWNNGSNPSFGGSCQFSNGAYHISQSKQGNFFCAAPTNTFSNLTVEVKMTIIMGDCGGIFLRGNGPAYFFGVYQNGQYGFYLYGFPTSSSIQTLVAGSSAAIHTGPNQSNVIAVVANGSNFDLYVNYQKINSASDNSVSSGEINFSAEDGSNPTEVAYSDARVWTP